MYAKTCVALALLGIAAGEANPRPTPAPTARAEESQVTAITDCHLHETDLFCFAGDAEYHVQTTVPTATEDLPAQFTDCHSHGEDFFCVDADGEDVMAINESGGEEAGEDEHNHSEEEGAAEENQHCHFHAGVEHCTGSSESEGESSNCDATPRDYNVNLRVGLLFVILATSALGVYGPIILYRFMPTKLNAIFLFLKQFGTGIIISTAFVHLYTHAALMFGSDCVGELGYEGVTSAIVMAGIFVSFIVEYIGQRVVQAKIRSEAALSNKERSAAILSSEVVSILVMEIGIIFHSLLIGLTLVVSGDSFFLTLFAVILFHQMFEGIALGTRIATIGVTAAHQHTTTLPDSITPDSGKSAIPAESSSESSASLRTGLSMKKKLLLAAVFAFITPIGMAIGIGVLKQFNGNDKSTLLAIGTLDAASAGILIWVGVVEMWAGDWMFGSHGHKAELADASLFTVAFSMFGLVSGLVVMSVLGKWA